MDVCESFKNKIFFINTTEEGKMVIFDIINFKKFNIMVYYLLPFYLYFLFLFIKISCFVVSSST